MENRRFLLICTLGVILYFMYQAWQQDFAPAPVAATERSTPAEAPDGDAPPLSTAPDDVPLPARRPDADPGSSPELSEASARIRVQTDVIDAEITLRGGDLRRVAFLQYPSSKDEIDTPVALIEDRPGRFFVVQSGLTSPDGAIATQHSEYTAARLAYRMPEAADRLIVPLKLTLDDGSVVTKRYHFERGSYRIDVEHEIENAGAARAVSPYVQLWRTDFALGGEPPCIQSFMGVGVYEQKDQSDSYRFRKFDADDLADEPLQLDQTGGWLAMMQHYFMAAIVPPAGEQVSFVAKPSATKGYLGQYLGEARTVAAGESADFRQTLFIGPKLQNRLEDVAEGFRLTIDYGILTPIAEPLFWLLSLLHDWIGNWGFAIIALTVLVKLALYKLSEAQYRSMAKMRKFAPRIQDIKDRYGDDRERLQKAMMDLYKKEGFNPLAGCWPLLVQFPVFIALYWVLLESVELRQADFIGYLNDLSSPDPYFVLPVLFGISMFVQQRLSGSAMTMDPMQQRIMNAMPIMLTAFFAFFPVGLVLYWLVSNLIGIAQQWLIMKRLDREGLRK